VIAAAALALAAALGAADPAARLAEANALLERGDAQGAARAYEALLEDGLDGAALHANLARARLRAGERGAAVASFLRALRRDPLDADARADLALARGRDADRLAAASGGSLLARVAARTPDAWAAAALALPWAALWTLLLARRLAGGRARSALGAGAAAAALCAAAGGVLLAARRAEVGAPAAVVVAREAPVRAAPDAALRPSFALDEGAEVRILERRGAAARVRLANGVEGWVPAELLEPL
jgi:hypothetical protein